MLYTNINASPLVCIWQENIRSSEVLLTFGIFTSPKPYMDFPGPQVYCEVICDQALNQMLFNEFLFMWGPHTCLKHSKSIVVRFRSAMVFWFCVKSTSKRWFLKIVQVTVKHDPFDAMQVSMQTFHPSCMHLLCWSLKHSVK